MEKQQIWAHYVFLRTWRSYDIVCIYYNSNQKFRLQQALAFGHAWNLILTYSEVRANSISPVLPPLFRRDRSR